MSPERLDLEAPRSLGELFRCTLSLQRRWFAVFFAVTAIVNVPVVIGVDGVWNRQLYNGPGGTPPAGAGLASTILSMIVVPALVTALHVRIVQRLAMGDEPVVGASFRLIAPVVLPAILATAFYVIGMVLGLFCLIVPGLLVLVRWYFAPQMAVVEGALGMEALARSRDLVKGRSWQVAGRLLAMTVTVAVLVAVPETIIGDAVSAGWVYLAAVAVLGTIGASLNALFGTLMFFSLRAADA